MNRKTFEISLSPQTARVIHQLRETGLFGLTDAEVIERMVDDRARDAINKGWALPPRLARATR